MSYPKAIQNLIDIFTKLPSVGPKTAERYVFFLLRQHPEELQRFAQYLAELKEKVTTCKICLTIAESDPCSICADQKRDAGVICVVEKPQDILALETAKTYTGRYHNLGGVINAIEEVKPENLNIKPLLARIAGKKINEIVLALNPDLEGETTVLYLTKLLKPYKVKISRLAKGLPMGADLEYADEITLANALKYRNLL
jgi:recombination protein RecR